MPLKLIRIRIFVEILHICLSKRLLEHVIQFCLRRNISKSFNGLYSKLLKIHMKDDFELFLESTALYPTDYWWHISYIEKHELELKLSIIW